MPDRSPKDCADGNRRENTLAIDKMRKPNDFCKNIVHKITENVRIGRKENAFLGFLRTSTNN